MEQDFISLVYLANSCNNLYIHLVILGLDFSSNVTIHLHHTETVYRCILCQDIVHVIQDSMVTQDVERIISLQKKSRLCLFSSSTW